MRDEKGMVERWDAERIFFALLGHFRACSSELRAAREEVHRQKGDRY